MKCHVCGAPGLAVSCEDLPYRSLPGVILANMRVETCAACGERFEHIPAIARLDRLLALILVSKRARLTGPEVRFLRKYLGLSATQAAKKLHVEKETVSRWETGARRISVQGDLLLRSIVRTGAPVRKFVDRMEELAVLEPQPLSSAFCWSDPEWEPASDGTCPSAVAQACA